MQRHAPAAVAMLAAMLAAAPYLSPHLAAQAPVPAPAPQGIPGERLPATAVSPLVRETLDVVLERERRLPPPDARIRGQWNGEDGQWYVPSESTKAPAHSGERAIINQWGDARIGIGFPFEGGADVLEVWAAGHGAAPASAVRFVGFRGGREVAATEWFALSTTMQRVRVELHGVERIEVQLEPTAGRQGWVALDDLAFVPGGRNGGAAPAATRTLDFETLPPRHALTGSGYGGLVWEQGRGFRLGDDAFVHAPRTEAPGAPEPAPPAQFEVLAMNGTAPVQWQDFAAARQGDPGATLIPPDTCGAAGADHFLSITNANISAWRKSDGARVLNTSLHAFWPGSSGTVGDPRAVWDPHSGRFVVLASNFSGGATIFVAISAGADPAGAWFKFSFQTNQGTDAGRWPDYPTLGVDARGIYTASYMVTGTARMTIWAIDKAPLVAPTPALGGIFAWRSLPFEGAIQPCTTYGDPGAQYLVSRASSTRLRLRRIDPPLTAPTLVEVGQVTIPSHSSPPSAPALGSSTAISTIDTRPLNAVFRNGSVWTTHSISSGGLAACRWYELSVSPASLVQYGTVADPLWHYYYPAIAVDAAGNAVLGFSGSHANAYPSAFHCGRLAGDPLGAMSPPAMFKAGEGPWNRLDGSGRNRFGDYSHTTVDPVDDVGFWTIQEYILPGNQWGTRVARLGYEALSYGSGLAGTTGEPTLRTLERPVIGQKLTFQIGNSLGSVATSAAFVAGAAQASTPLLGGTLLVQPTLVLPFALSGGQGTLPVTVPNQLPLVGMPVYFQVVEADAGAPFGVSMTPGLEVRPGSR